MYWRNQVESPPYIYTYGLKPSDCALDVRWETDFAESFGDSVDHTDNYFGSHRLHYRNIEE